MAAQHFTSFRNVISTSTLKLCPQPQLKKKISHVTYHCGERIIPILGLFYNDYLHLVDLQTLKLKRSIELPHTPSDYSHITCISMGTYFVGGEHSIFWMSNNLGEDSLDDAIQELPILVDSSSVYRSNSRIIRFHITHTGYLCVVERPALTGSKMEEGPSYSTMSVYKMQDPPMTTLLHKSPIGTVVFDMAIDSTCDFTHVCNANRKINGKTPESSLHIPITLFDRLFHSVCDEVMLISMSDGRVLYIPLLPYGKKKNQKLDLQVLCDMQQPVVSIHTLSCDGQSFLVILCKFGLVKLISLSNSASDEDGVCYMETYIMSPVDESVCFKNIIYHSTSTGIWAHTLIKNVSKSVTNTYTMKFDHQKVYDCGTGGFLICDGASGLQDSPRLLVHSISGRLILFSSKSGSHTVANTNLAHVQSLPSLLATLKLQNEQLSSLKKQIKHVDTTIMQLSLATDLLSSMSGEKNKAGNTCFIATKMQVEQLFCLQYMLRLTVTNNTQYTFTNNWLLTISYKSCGQSDVHNITIVLSEWKPRGVINYKLFIDMGVNSLPIMISYHIHYKLPGDGRALSMCTYVAGDVVDELHFLSLRKDSQIMNHLVFNHLTSLHCKHVNPNIGLSRVSTAKPIATKDKAHPPLLITVPLSSIPTHYEGAEETRSSTCLELVQLLLCDCNKTVTKEMPNLQMKDGIMTVVLAHTLRNIQVQLDFSECTNKYGCACFQVAIICESFNLACTIHSALIRRMQKLHHKVSNARVLKHSESDPKLTLQLQQILDQCKETGAACVRTDNTRELATNLQMLFHTTLANLL